MIETIVKDIIEYIIGHYGTEEHDFNRLIEYYFFVSKFNLPNEDQTKQMRENFLKIKEIREIYQKGKPFVKNQSKKQKKGINFRWYNFLQMKLDRNELEEAKKEAIKHLEFIKKYQSERTYYRHKKKIRALGIPI